MQCRMNRCEQSQHESHKVFEAKDKSPAMLLWPSLVILELDDVYGPF